MKTVLEVLYVDLAHERLEDVARRRPDIFSTGPSGVEYVGGPGFDILRMDDPRAAYNAALRRFARGG